MWNYAQAIPHLFPMLERTFRNAEFHEDQNEEGHQEFRSALPIRKSGQHLPRRLRRAAGGHYEDVPGVAHRRGPGVPAGVLGP